MRFQDKVVISSGGSVGVGIAVAQRLAIEGARCVLVGGTKTKLDQAADMVRKAGAPDVWSSVCDVAIKEQVEVTVAGTLERFNPVDCIINNAEQMEFKPIKELTGDDWQRAIGVDLLGAFYLINQAFFAYEAGRQPCECVQYPRR